MRNSSLRASTRSLRASDGIRTYLNDRSQECDDQIDEIHERIRERKRLSAAAPRPSSSSSSLRSSRSPTMKKKSATFRFDSDSEDNYSHPSSSSRPQTKPSMSQSFSSSRGILKSSSLSSSPERPQPISQKHQQHRGILRKPSPKLKESPEQWFQRIMEAKKLSPLDLCDLFSYGDTRKHPRVPLSHVCEVIFDLDPEVLNSGHDPVTPEMEEFLYHYSFEGASGGSEGGDEMILVDVKDALRSLNIWQSGVTSRVKKTKNNSSGGPINSESPTKSVVLEVKNKKLQGVISSLQDANLRLSMQLDDAVKSSQQKSAKPHSGKPRPFSTSMSISSASWLTSSELENSKASSSKPTLTNSVVSHHEDDLIRIANQLQYTGVKQLEELLIKSDKPSSSSSSADPTRSGFVSLKQLRWLLSEHFQVASVSETQLMESCLGMNFNAQAQLGYNEFIHVLLDILIYAIPKPSSSKRRQFFDKIKQYLDSGFPPHSSKNEDNRASKSHHPQLLMALCEKYDLEGDQLVSVSEMMRVFYKDLVTLHALNLPFPLNQQDALRILQPFIQTNGGDHQKTASNFLSYPELLQALFASSGDEDNGSESKTGRQALDWSFWTQLRKALCSGNLALEPKIHTQLCKIFKKVDPHRQFLISQRSFNRILDQHLSSSDLEILTIALAQPSETESLADFRGRHAPAPPASLGPSLRFDVFMKLVFGVPALQDTIFLSQQIVTKLVENETPIRENVVDAMKKHGGGWETSMKALRELMSHSDKSASHPSIKISTELTGCELLYLFAYLDDGHEGIIELQTLWAFLKNECWTVKREGSKTRGDKSDHRRTSKSGGHSHNAAATLHTTKKALARCLDAYDLERALSGYHKQQEGAISQDQLLKEIFRMLSALGSDTSDDGELDVANVQQVLSHIAIQANDADPELFSMGRLKLSIPIDAFFDELFDYDAMVKAMRLPQSLSEVKKTLELFDWSKDGSIPVQDWIKAWRQICGVHGATTGNRRKEMAEWEVRVLQRRFSTCPPGTKHQRQSKSRASSDEEGSIDYARLLVHLMDTQHQSARERLKKLVMTHFYQRCAEMRVTKAPNARNLTSQQVDRLFRQIDESNKGHFNLRDLQNYFSKQVEGDGGGDDSGDSLLMQNVNVMGFVLGEIAGYHNQRNTSDFAESRRSGDSMDHQRVRATTVTRERFQEFMQSLMGDISSQPSSPKRRPGGSARRHGDNDDRDWKTSSRSSPQPPSHDDGDNAEDSGLSPRSKSKPQVLTSLRALELAILDICSDVASENGRKILSTRAFRYFSEGFVSSNDSRSRSGSPRSRSRSRSPTRGSTVTGSQSASPTRKSRTSASTTTSMTSRSQHRQVEAMALNPITPAKLKRVLLDDHDLQVATHIVSQFFLHIGSPSDQFLELLPFAKWVAPISLDMELKVRDVVKRMVMRGKGGGGKVDLDRFLGQVQRKLLDSPPYSSGGKYGGDGYENLASDEELRFVSPSLLQMKLNQLDIPLSRVDMETLLRHFGMEEDLEVDFALFLQRIVELSVSLTPSTS